MWELWKIFFTQTLFIVHSHTMHCCLEQRRFEIAMRVYEPYESCESRPNCVPLTILIFNQKLVLKKSKHKHGFLFSTLLSNVILCQGLRCSTVFKLLWKTVAYKGHIISRSWSWLVICGQYIKGEANPGGWGLFKVKMIIILIIFSAIFSTIRTRKFQTHNFVGWGLLKFV